MKPKLPVLFALLCAFSIGSAALFPEEAGAQKRRHAKAKAEAETESEEAAAIDAPVDMKKFPGTGSIDAWKQSVPEFRSGMLKMKEHKWDEAIAAFRASIALYEFQPKAWLQIGRATEAKDGLVLDAEKAFRRSLQLDSQSWAAWKCLSNNLYLQKRFPEAREAAANGIQLGPPQRGRQELDKIIQSINSAQKDSNTLMQNNAQ